MTLPKEVREAMARAMWAYFVSRHPDPDSFLLWEELRPSTQDDYRNNVDAALSALGEAGYALAKIEPTQAMVNAARATQYDDKSYSVLRVWDAMLAASQEETK